MRTRFTLFAGIFTVMALSNAIVPVLPAYGADTSWHGLIYAAYFLGAFLITLPAGILSDRYGRMPLVRLGLAITVTSGLFLAVTSGPFWAIAARFAEGLGAGLFVAAALSAVNSDPAHLRMSGWFMALLNAGLVTGLLLAGLLAASLQVPSAGILLFSLLAALPALISFFAPEPHGEPGSPSAGMIASLIADYRWLWYSSLILIGVTGVITSLYPGLSGASPDRLGSWIAGMSVVTIGAVVIYSRTTLAPVPVIRIAAVAMAAGIVLSFFSPAGFLVIGALAGIVMIAQMAFLAGVREHQGVAMGLFTMMSYLGMALLPAAAGFLARDLGFAAAFGLTALASLTVAFTIGRCSCPARG
jgi:MFS family permease